MATPGLAQYPEAKGFRVRLGRAELGEAGRVERGKLRGAQEPGSSASTCKDPFRLEEG